MVNARVSVDLGGVTKKMSPQNIKRGKLAAGTEAISIMKPYVPMRSGAMKAAVYVDTNGDVVYTRAPYVRPQFYGTNGIVTFRKYRIKGTGKRWDKSLKPNVGRLKQAAVKAMGLK